MQEQLSYTTFSPPVADRLAGLWPRLAPVVGAVETAPSDKTAKQYRNAWRRMRESNQWPEEMGKRNRKSFNVYRAALVFCAKETVRNRYARITDEGDIISRGDAAYLVNDIEHSLAILKRYPPHGGGTACQWSVPDEGQTKKGKRRGISKLPENWRERMAQACPNTSRYAAPLLLSALVGLRPQELKHGAIVGVVDGHIAVWIQGAKVTTKNGQPDRGMTFLIDNAIARMLADIVVAKKGDGGKLKVSIKDPRKFCDVVRSLSRRVFPEADYIVTPYSFRHAFSADQKAQKVDPVDLAKALGHASARSQRTYGSAGQGRRPLIRITEVVAPRTVRALDRTKDYRAQQDRMRKSALDMKAGLSNFPILETQSTITQTPLSRTHPASTAG